MPTNIEAKEQLSNYKCKYRLTKKFHFQKTMLQIYSPAHKAIHYSIICCSKRVETIHMPVKWRLLNMNCGTLIQWVIPQNYERMRKLSLD